MLLQVTFTKGNKAKLGHRRRSSSFYGIPVHLSPLYSTASYLESTATGKMLSDIFQQQKLSQSDRHQKGNWTSKGWLAVGVLFSSLLLPLPVCHQMGWKYNYSPLSRRCCIQKTSTHLTIK